MMARLDTAYVEDGGGRYDGQAACTSFLKSGWSEDQNAEQSVAQASASASVNAGEAKLEQATAADIASLRAAPSFDQDLAQIATDVKQADTDLAKERSDAKHGQGDQCYNVGSVVGYDAENDVGYDVQSTLGYDLTSHLADDIAALRSSVAAVQHDVDQLSAAGLPAPVGAIDAIRTARSRVAAAIASANRQVDHANSDVRTAYAIANGLATGACAGYGPGEPPSSLAHLR